MRAEHSRRNLWLLALACGGAWSALGHAPAAAESLGALQDAPRPVAAGATLPAVESRSIRVLAPPTDAAPRAVVDLGGTYLAPPRHVRRGPVEVRDEWLLAQPRLTLPALSPDPVGRGRWRVRVATNRGNDFGWAQTAAGEQPLAGDRRFLIDGEHQTTEASLRYGLTSTLDLAARVPVQWRGAGFMDSIIDAFHEAFAWAGFLDNNRPDFTNDLYRVEGRDDAFVPFSWNDERGWGLGNVELAAHWAFAGAQPGARWTWAAVGRVTLPTATGPYEVGGVDAGLQLLAAVRLGPAWDLYLGGGATWFGEAAIDGVEYERLRGSGFVALEWRPAPTWSLLVELNGSSNLATNIALYPTIQTYVNVAAKIDLSCRWMLEAGFTENIVDQQSTIDVGVYLGLVSTF